MLPIIPYTGKALANLFRKPSTEKFPVGPAPQAAPQYRGRISYDATKCINCGMCERVCPMGAVRVVDGRAVIDDEKCVACGMCATKCPRGAIHDANGIMAVR